ncbi:hypothetical protein BN439_2898 [Erwinia amylovora Ea644]|nr:hypothetical protein BN439_2898 [Erwinia amylovora Ea644]
MMPLPETHAAFHSMGNNQICHLPAQFEKKK